MCDKPTSLPLLSLLARADTGPAGAPGDAPVLVPTQGPVTGAGVFLQEGEAVPAAVAGLPLAQALARGEALASTAAPNAEDTPVPRGSRRRRLWELPSQALCPVIGVCLPMPVLRRKLGKLLGGQALSNDYEMHCGAINECARRGPVSEMLQKELDQRFAIALRQSSQHKTAEALTRWWHAAQQGNDVGGALWGALTHARCDAALQEQILRDIHMLQHQVGAANRADLQRLDELQDEHAVLTRELAQAQKQWRGLPDGTRPRLLFVSVDPERDTPDRIGEYAHGFDPDTLAATADIPALEAFAKSLSLVFAKVPAPEGVPADQYSVDHSAAIAVLDPQARMAGVIQPPLDPQAIASDMARTVARAAGSFGSSGGLGRVSSRYSMMASDCDSRWPSASKAGINPCGLIFKYSVVRCSFLANALGMELYVKPFTLRAMRTRKAAELRKKV